MVSLNKWGRHVRPPLIVKAALPLINEENKNGLSLSGCCV